MFEIPLFYEPFVAYLSKNHPLMKFPVLDLSALNLSEMLLLSEGHCFRYQVINICPKRKEHLQSTRLQFESGSLETLKRIVEKDIGYTLLPELATLNLNPSRKQFLRGFRHPQPVREVSIVIQRSFLKEQLIAVFRKELLASLPASLRRHAGRNVVDWT